MVYQALFKKIKDDTSAKDLWFKLGEEYLKKNQDKEKEAEVKDENQEENQVLASDTSEGKYSSMVDNSECNDDEVVLTEDEEEVLLKANNALTSTLTDIDLRSNPRLKNKMLRSFEKYKEETKALLMKLKLKNKYLQVKLQDQNDEIKELKIGLAKEQEEIGVDPKDLEEARWVSTDLKVHVEEANRIEDVMKLQLE